MIDRAVEPDVALESRPVRGGACVLAALTLVRFAPEPHQTTAWHNRRCWPLAGTMRAACTGLLAVLALAALHGARAQTTQSTYAPEVGDGWRRGRATFFGGDERFLSQLPGPRAAAGVRLWQHPLRQLRLLPAGACLYPAHSAGLY